MTTPDNKPGDRKDGRSRDEVLAGEYVLGVLPIAERKNVEKRIRDDRAFASIVDRWQANLTTFNDEYQETDTPQPWVYAAIEKQLFAADTPTPGTIGQRLWNSVVFWRGLTLVACSAALLLAFNTVGTWQNETAEPTLLATLSDGNSNISLVTYYDQASGHLKISPAAVDQKAKSLELWLIEGKDAPIPLGILPDSPNGEIIIPQEMRDHLKGGVTLAVSLEPLGGSPTGKPTGPVIASGVAGSI